MIIVSHDYRIIKRKDMTENFIIRPEYVKRVWDITEHAIGISFIPSYDKYDYRIELDGNHKNLLAKDLLQMIRGNENITICGEVKIK